MSKPLTQIGDEVREMTDAEFQVWEVESAEAQAKMEALANEIAKVEAKRESALAKLEALGLTTDDLKALGL
jgi:hypothetical protein